MLVRQVGSIPICGIDINGFAVLNSAFMIICKTIPPFYLLGILNSKLIKFYWKHKFEDKRITFPKIKGSYLEEIPIKYIDGSSIESLAYDIYLKTNEGLCADEEINKIDILVYKIYGLSFSEILLVDPLTTITMEEYEKGGIL